VPPETLPVENQNMERIRGPRRATNRTGTNLWLSPIRLGIAAVIFHLAVTTAVDAIGRFALLPGTFDTNGIAKSFAPDGVKDRAAMVRLSELLRRGQIRGWITAAYPFHFKLYSICFAVFGPLLGFTIIGVEPLNALCYLGSLVLVSNLGQETFNRRAGLLAAASVGIWPSFLLHTTQLLRDPLFVTGMLALILINLRLLSRSLSWRRALLHGVGGGLVAIFLWFTRDNMGELMIAVAFLGAGMLIVRQLLERRFLTTNSFGLMLLIVIAVGVSRVLPRFRDPLVPPRTTVAARLNENASPLGDAGTLETLKTQPPIPRWDIAARVVRHRAEFIRFYPDAASSIDLNVQLTSRADLIRYLPRAAVIGFFAPFPDMWFASGGHVGSVGRLLSGLETLAMYVVEALALVGLWRGRWRLSVWLLLSVALMGIVALGLVVVNVGALYRLRYFFLILMIILAAEGAAQALDWYRREPAMNVRRTAERVRYSRNHTQ